MNEDGPGDLYDEDEDTGSDDAVRARLAHPERGRGGFGVHGAYEPMPFPDRDNMPIDDLSIPRKYRWTPKRWMVYCSIHEGMTSKEAADACGYSLHTVRELRKRWHFRFGRGIEAKDIAHVRADPRYRRPPETAEQRQVTVVDEFDVVASQARSVVSIWFSQFIGQGADSEDRIRKLSHGDVKAIQDIGLTAQKAAIDLARARGELAPPAKGNEASSSAKAAVKGLSRPPVKGGPKGQAAENAGAVVQDLRTQLTKFRESKASGE